MNYTEYKMDDGKTPDYGKMRHLHDDAARSLFTRIFKQNLPEQRLGGR